MGQKVNPISMRLGINKTWKSRWYVEPGKYADVLHQDLALRRFLHSSPLTRGADIKEVEIVRHPKHIFLLIHTARPGILIGSKGANIENISAQLQKLAGKKVRIKIQEIKQASSSSQIIALNIARQLRNRVAYRRVLKMTIANAMKSDLQGVKIKISGRLGGMEMSRTVTMKDGRIPLHTLRANIDYGFTEAHTTFGAIGVKVWTFTGEVYRNARNYDAGLLVKKKGNSNNRASQRS